VETATSMGVADGMTQDERLNEIEYFNLAKLLEEQKGIPIPEEREGFVQHLPQVFSAWQNGEIENPPESWTHFETRVRDVLTEINQGAGPALVVTSGGLISMVMAQAMGLNSLNMARIALAIMNTSVHRLYPIGDHLSPVLFNAVPHLEDPARHYAQTHL
jgi:broad specificity phosphatase PhoE